MVSKNLVPEIMSFHNFDGTITNIKKGHGGFFDNYKPGIASIEDGENLKRSLTMKIFDNWLKFDNSAGFCNICNMDIGIDADMLKKLGLYNAAYEDWQQICIDMIMYGKTSESVIFGNYEDYRLDMVYYSPDELMELWYDTECNDEILKKIVNFGLSDEKTELLYNAYHIAYNSNFSVTNNPEYAAAAGWLMVNMIKEGF